MRGTLRLLALCGLMVMTAWPAGAFEFGQGDWSGNLDTTLSYGLIWRVQDRDERLIGTANGGTARSVNYDDGNLNYKKGLISNVIKATSELAVNYRRTTGVFLRATGFYDFENQDGSRERTPLSDPALDLVGKDIRLLDAFVWGDFKVGEMPAQLRVGEQVVSWGESTFIQNGINVINPVNVNAIRLPGAELREALLPEGLIWGSLGLTDNISLEGFYLYDWDETEIDPPGSYWSTNDFVGPGGQKVLLGFGEAPDNGVASAQNTFLAVPRGPDHDADDSGQFGIALRVFAPGLNNTEFGFYYMNYHSRLPIISARTGSVAGATGAGTISAVTPDIITSVIANGGNPAPAIAAYSPVIGQAAATAIAGATAQGLANGIPAAQAAGASAATAFATDAYAKTARYIVEYPEDIQLFGVSFNTMLTGSGIALQGEYSLKKDAPLQVDDIELLFAALGPINEGLAQFNQVGNFQGQFNTYIPGYILKDVSQIQMTASKLFGPTLGANQFALIGEIGLTHVHNMPKKSQLRLDGPGTPISGNENLAGSHFNELEPAGRFADATSWGYRLVGRLDFNNAIGAVTLSPRIAWQHDVEGTTPGPGGNFVEDRKAVTFGLGADYQNRWGADLAYTNFFGAGRYNLINDRDIIAASVKYSF
ncbi:DUF1302 domain-containing protein [Geoalkalibacter sp.]|uniref:DUF1302 domain-containing protein n=1 Tax=Geoalkalibacter sp. TaxID=3041440 RepID=UPI00272E0C13|nr:DUF1302 domain-containing protein [Geoalkalibacter sp.]